MIDDQLKWDVHINNLCKSVAYKVHFLSKLSKTVNSTLLNILYKSMIQPCYDYACSVWGNCPVVYKRNLLRTQKRAARIVKNNFNYEETSGINLMKELSWPNIEQRRDYFLATLMYKCINGLAPLRLCNEIEMYFDRHNFNTRNANSLNVIVPKPNHNYYKQTFRYAGAKIWNQLPTDLQNATSLNMFKSKYKQLYLKF